jgi:hypothetical protein
MSHRGEMSHRNKWCGRYVGVTIHPNRLRVDEKSGDILSVLKQNIRLKCQRGIVSQWMFQVGVNVTVDETWVDVM